MTQIITNNGWGWGGGWASYTAWTWIDITSNEISIDEAVVQTVDNMVEDLDDPDNTHYPTAKAVADAISSSWWWDMSKSVYDPTNVEGDAFDYDNFHNVPAVKTFELMGLTDYTTMQDALNYYLSGGLAIVMYGWIAYKHTSMSILYSDVPRVFSASTITVKMLVCELSWTTVTRIDNPTMDFTKSAIVDNLTTQSATSALSANQWYVLDGKISTINWKIPSAATSSNQLADKNYVNDGINSVTAYYITKNAQGDQWSTRAELFAATTFYSGWVVRVPTKNDYTIVLSDEQHDNATTRYIYNSGWEYQYTVNETALTQAQLDAINSWITSGKVSTYDGYASAISWKQDALTLPATPTQWHLVTWGADNETFVDGWAVPTGVPSGWNNGDVLTNVSWTPTWSAPSGWDVMVSSQSWNILTSWMKIWAWTEADYWNLWTYDSNTLYLTVE